MSNYEQFEQLGSGLVLKHREYDALAHKGRLVVAVVMCCSFPRYGSRF